VSLEGLHYVAKRKPGKPVRWYVYAWRGGPLVARREGRDRPVLKADEIRAAMAAQESVNRPDPRLLLSLIREWQASPEWKGLAAGTRKTWGSPLNAIEARWGSKPLSVWNDPRMVAKVVAWRDERAATPRAADIGVTVLRELLKFGKLRARVLLNVADGIPTLYRGGDRAEIIWTEEDMDRFGWYSLKLDMAHVTDGLWLDAFTGLRREDLVTVNEANVWEHAIVKKALKVSRRQRRRAAMPRLPELNGLLEELRTRPRQDGVTTLLVNSRGLPWTGDGFGGSFNRIRDAANIVHADEETGLVRKKHLHDVRGTFATRLILAGLTDEEAANVMGWSPQRIATIRRVYVDQARVVVAIGERIASGTNRDGVNPPVNRSGGDHEK
jgi:integrase